MNFFAGCQNNLPELLFGCELPPTLIDLLLEDAPKVLNRVEVREGWGPHHKFLSSYAQSSQGCRGIPCCMTWCIVMHEDEAQFFFLYHGRKWSVRNSTYFSEVIFTPSEILKGPTGCLPMTPAQKMTPCHLLADVAALLGHGGRQPTIHYSIHLDHPGLVLEDPTP